MPEVMPVTGGSGGIGAEISRKAAGAGFGRRRQPREGDGGGQVISVKMAAG
jgi:NAD(P)-dependent dehydrogenase (short-subunit alcohol dehydrogenase family)